MAADHAFRIPMSSNSAETARRTKYACLVEVTPRQADSCSAATYVRFGPKADSGTIATTMGQFALLAAPVLLIMQLLSGSATPMESMPVWLQYLMQITSPTPHFVAFSQAVLYRGADLTTVWPLLAAMAVIGSVYFIFALKRFHRVIFGS